MNIKELLAKLTKGETLADNEKTFLAEYDPDREANAKAAAARKEADAKLAEIKAQVEKLTAEKEAQAKEAQAKLEAKMTDAQKQQKAFEELSAKVEALEKDKAAAEAKAAKMVRSQAIREAAKSTGINLAPGTVNEKLFFGMLEAHVGDIDVNDVEALNSSLQGFKKDNAGIIVADGGGSGMKFGSPGGGKKSGDDYTLEERTADMKKRGLI